jgi:hypothetical protein
MIPVRKSLAAGLIEVVKMLDLSSQDSSDKNSTFLLEVAQSYLNDDERKVKLAFLPFLCDFVAKFSTSH